MILDLKKRAVNQYMLKILRGNCYRDKASGLLRLSCLIAFILANTVCYGQKYTFTHYDIQDGLIQSQVNDLTLDQQHRLWIATLGGACRFDGKEFISFSRQNGMPTNFVNVVLSAKNNDVWFGTQSGLVRMTGRKMTIIKLPDNQENKRVRNIVQDGNGKIWAIIGGRLFSIAGDKARQHWVQDTIRRLLTTIAVDKAGRLYASVYRRGLYLLDGGRWTNITDYPSDDKSFVVSKIVFDRAIEHRIYLQTYTALFTVEDGELMPFESKAISSIKSYLLCLTQDVNNNFWIGTSSGVYSLQDHQLIHFTAQNGLSDNAVSDIYNDADNNLWFATQGNGLYKYEGDRFITFDRSQGMPFNEVVMGIVKNKKGDVLLGIDGGGLMRYDGKKLYPVELPVKEPALMRIQALYCDSKGTLWIGTHEGLWTYDNKTLKEIKEVSNYAINGIAEDSSGVIWVTTAGGCFYYQKGQLFHVANYYRFSSAIAILGRDSVMVGTNDGIALIVNKELVKGFAVNDVKTSAVFCILKYRNYLLFGTDDRGIFAWDRNAGKVRNYGIKDGLNSNTIYSLVADENGVIWAGTGRGVNKLSFDKKKNLFALTGNGSPKSLILESNQNASLYTDHKVWIGTTKGAIIYDVNSKQERVAPPHVIIQSARMVPKEGAANGWLNSVLLKDGAILSHSQNHLAIWFRGVDLRDPNGISYRYKLKGLDTNYSTPITNDVVDYPSLPAGKYTFQVTAVSSAGIRSANTASFSFTITPAFYQTVWFRVAGIAFFILIGFIIQNYRHRVKVNRQRMIEATKREESLKIRQQTAEDFHDELGNKLTRITVLSEILDTKMDVNQADQKKLLEQIKQNASSLYNGTKDILWALDPQSDNLYEILNHIKDFGSELFLDTPVEFEFTGIEESLNEIKLPMEYSRNIPMIFKELLNNILKHAHATRVILNLDDVQKDEMHLTLKDNGCGFSMNGSPKGQGINNIVTRTRRIGGEINISSEKGHGTLVDLKIRINNAITH